MSREESDDYYRGFHDGYIAAKGATSPEIPAWPKSDPVQGYWVGCKVCGIGLRGMNNYCCMQPNCPSRTQVSCSNSEAL